MSQVRFIGCLHFSHESVAKWRDFENSFYHDELLISHWNRTVHKKDLTYILGDVTMEKSNDYYQLDRLNGRKIVVLGNHDLWQDVPKLLNSLRNHAKDNIYLRVNDYYVNRMRELNEFATKHNNESCCLQHLQSILQ